MLEAKKESIPAEPTGDKKQYVEWHSVCSKAWVRAVHDWHFSALTAGRSEFYCWRCGQSYLGMETTIRM